MLVHANHNYLLEVIKEPGEELLVQEPFEDLAFLGEEARYRATSRGLVANEPQQLSARLEPLYEPDAEPRVASLRLRMFNHRTSRLNLDVDFSREIVAPRGRELVAQLMTEGRLQEGDHYRVRLCAVNKSPLHGAHSAAGDEEQKGELEEQPFPVVGRALDSWGISADALAQADPRRPVFVARAILEQAVAEAVGHFNVETGTLLLGQLVADDALLHAGKETGWAVVVTEQVPIPDGVGTATSFTFPPEAMRAARQLAVLRNHGELVIGSQHSHGWRCRECELKCEINNLYFSADDVRMAELFPIYSVFLVVGGDPQRDRDNPVVNLYVRLDGTMQSIPFGTF
jgi:hypothetical protein